MLRKVLGQRLLDQRQVFGAVDARGLVDVIWQARCARIQDRSSSDAMGATIATSDSPTAMRREHTHVHGIADHGAIGVCASTLFTIP